MFYKQNVLNLVNAFREKIDLKSLTELPKGIREDCSQCPIARALEVPVYVTEETIEFKDSNYAKLAVTSWYKDLEYQDMRDAYEHTDVYVSVVSPSEMSEFIQEFDAGNIPELEE